MISICRILKLLKKEVSPRTHVNIMSQYRPMGDAKKVKELSLPLSPGEFIKAREIGREPGLELISGKKRRFGDCCRIAAGT